MALFSLLNWNLEYRLQWNRPPTLKNQLSLIYIYGSGALQASTVLAVCSPQDRAEGVCEGGEGLRGLSRLGHGFKGLQYEVGLVDEPVCTDEDI